MATPGHVRDWSSFQHYKDRSPPWIKFHRALLNDREFMCLPVASKALAPLLWLLAAETNDGYIDLDAAWIAWRLRLPEEEVEAGLTPLIQKGFLIPASDTLATCKQVATPETERETETEGEVRASKKAKKGKEADVTLTEWMDALDGADAIPANDSLFGWAQSIGIPRDWIALAWWAFEARYAENGKRYSRWREVFRRAVKEDWLKLWRNGRDGWELTTAGVAVQREMRA